MSSSLLRWLLTASVAVVSIPACSSGPPADESGAIPVAQFHLTERGGRMVRRDDLLGKVWIASFVFTRCTEGCAQVTQTMAQLQNELAGERDIVLVTFTIDPDHDQPDELKKYAAFYGADPDRWLFLTGKESAIHALCQQSFGQAVVRDDTREPGKQISHGFRLALVDRQGFVRDYCNGLPPRHDSETAEFEQNLRRFRANAIKLATDLIYPKLNALLNAASACCLLLGYLAIRNRRIGLHKTCMMTALVGSAIFLGFYLYYHFVIRHGQPTRFSDRAPDAPALVGYFYSALLLSHTILAAIVAPLAIYTAYQGLRDRLARHVKIARWTLPIWLYVSVTGVAVYWMLYRLYPFS